MAIPLEKKKENVADLKQRISEGGVFILSDYIGLTVAQINDLRKRLRHNGCHLKVYKNTLVQKAISELGDTKFESLKEHLSGPTVIAFGGGDPIPLCKQLVEFSKESEVFRIKAGYYEGNLMEPASIEMLSKLGSKEALIGKLIMQLKAPMYRLINALHGPMTGLVGTLQAVQK